ncbi:PREDICTED: F-box/kelch-repeat protein At3g23880 [Camelina sativa]|uniref:F-box/kelch-repeat protein At3g23880 n=1 Tax=Camelina sativa TaxID=90675 RepID=A0ABM0SLI4_CAMSA|nr:PREDICTED: F-box/kelch-repeat protein At3g23880 [Camelina sativa]
MAELAFDIVVEILARVPVKDLLRFRCVCKSWRSLFRDERFIIKHKNHVHAPSTLFLLVVCWPRDTPRICTYEGRKLKTVLQEPELYNDREKSLLFITRVTGHCDGLFCLLLQDKSLAVWNPVLRGLRKVGRINHQHTSSMIGFGYDHSTHDHKIVLIPLTISYKAQVLTLESTVSKMIDFPWRTFIGLSRVNPEGILVGENIFWSFHPRESATIENGEHIFGSFHTHESTTTENGENILSFSLVSETFNYCSGPGGNFFHLKLLKGSLCAVENCYGGDMVVWCAEHEKEDNGRIKSWSTILRLTASDVERSTRLHVGSFWLGAVINQAGLLLVKVRTRKSEIKLCEYNLEEKTMRTVETSLRTSLDYLENMEEYVATLVPTRPHLLSI